MERIIMLPGRKIVKDRVPARVVEQVTMLTKQGYKALTGLEISHEITHDEDGKKCLTRVFTQVMQKDE